MKIAPDIPSVHAIRAYGPGWVRIGADTLTHSVLLGPDGQRQHWPCRRHADLDAQHFAPLLEWAPELVLFGSGERLRFAPAQCLQALIERQIGVETMDAQAACRTYNLLLAEGRRVALALLLEDPAG